MAASLTGAAGVLAPEGRAGDVGFDPGLVVVVELVIAAAEAVVTEAVAAATFSFSCSSSVKSITLGSAGSVTLLTVVTGVRDAGGRLATDGGLAAETGDGVDVSSFGEPPLAILDRAAAKIALTGTAVEGLTEATAVAVREDGMTR